MLSMTYRAVFKGTYRTDRLQRALSLIPRVVKVAAQDDGIYAYIKAVGNDLMVGVVKIEGEHLDITCSGQFYLGKNLSMYYNAVVQAEMLEGMGFRTEIRTMGENVRVQAVK